MKDIFGYTIKIGHKVKWLDVYGGSMHEKTATIEGFSLKMVKINCPGNYANYVRVKPGRIAIFPEEVARTGWDKS